MQTHSKQSEESLWKSFILGNNDAFELLVNGIYPSLFQYGCKFSRDPEMIKDCIQDVFLRVWESRANLNHSIPPMPYLFASLRRQLHQQVTRNAGAAMDYWETEYFEAVFTVEDAMISSEASKELSDRFAALLNGLPSRQKEIVLLKFFENLSREEIAATMQITPQSVSNTLQKSLNWLRNNWPTTVLPAALYLCKYFDKNFQLLKGI
jgi:RNA polymerase sigma factor (sigma-70 family)